MTNPWDDIKTNDGLLFPVLDWAEEWDKAPESEPWIVRPIVSRNRVVSIYSKGGAGKSLFMLELAAAIATGREVHGQPVETPQRVLYIDHENLPGSDVIPRLKRMGYAREDLPALQENLRYLSFPDMYALNTLAGASQLLAAVEEHQARHVVLDTVSRVVEGDENSNDTWLTLYRLALLPLKGQGIGSTRLDHSGKDVDKGARGGSAKGGDVDLEYSLTWDDGTNEVTLRCTKTRIPEVRDGETFTYSRRDNPTRHEPIQGNATERATAKRGEDLERVILELITAQPGVNKSTIEKTVSGDNNLIRARLEDLVNRQILRVEIAGKSRKFYSLDGDR